MQNTSRRIVKNTGVMLLGDGINNLLYFFIVIYLVRYLGESGFGKYSFVLVYISFFNFLTYIGINKIIVREISKNNAINEKIIGNALTIRLFLSILSIILSFIIINLLNYPYDTKILVYIASISLFSSSLSATYSSIFQTYLKMEYSMVANLVERIISAILILLIIVLKGSIVYIIIAIVISNFFNLFVTCLFSRKFVKPVFEFEFYYAKQILTSSIPIGITAAFRVIYYRIDVIMISLMKTESDIGYYASAYTLISPLNLIPSALMFSVFPLMSRSSKKKERYIEIYEKSFRVMLIIALPIAVITTFFSDHIIYLIYGNNFLPSAPALSILVWSVVFMFMNIIFGNVIVSMNKQIITAYTSCIMAIVNIILNYFVIPQYNFIGASITTVITEALGTTMLFWYIYTKLIKKTFITTILKLVLLNITLYIFLTIFNYIPIYLLVILSMIFYIFLLIVSKCITKEEIKLLKSSIRL